MSHTPSTRAEPDAAAVERHRIAVHSGVIGYFCACGNVEVLDHEHLFYTRFRAHARARGPMGTPLITCQVCKCPAHEPSALLPPP